MPDHDADRAATGPASARPLPGGRWGRMVRPALLGARSAAGLAGGWVSDRLTPVERRDEQRIERLVRTAEDAVAVLGEMKGAVMKLGQLLSFADLGAVPPELREVLGRLQADAPPMAWELVEEVVAAELGAHPDACFERFSRVPIAAASIGQVHSARLPDGTDVVVKVQYPGVAAAIESDLRNTAVLSNLALLAQAVAGPLMPRSDVKALVAELQGRVLEELDYEREAANQTELAERFRSQPGIRIPEVVADRSTQRVLTSHYHDGMRWSAALRQPQELKDRWGEAIYRFSFESLYRHRFVNADPHPGNYLFHDDGTVTFLDFGCTRRFTPGQLAELRRLAEAVLAQDAATLARLAVTAGVLDRPDDVPGDWLLEHATVGYQPVLAPQPFTFTTEWAAELVRRQTNLAPEHVRRVNRLSVPPHWLFLGRLSIGVGAVLAALGATGHWRETLGEIWAAADGDAECAAGGDQGVGTG